MGPGRWEWSRLMDQSKRAGTIFSVRPPVRSLCLSSRMRGVEFHYRYSTEYQMGFQTSIQPYLHTCRKWPRPVALVLPFLPTSSPSFSSFDCSTSGLQRGPASSHFLAVGLKIFGSSSRRAYRLASAPACVCTANDGQSTAPVQHRAALRKGGSQ